ncbi:MAG TPA: hypothetical protein VL403_03055, partial [Candidatus Kryptonia bacterium]|nr:hypothetical protein [Candidatus Kryptonia bacterium]
RMTKLDTKTVGQRSVAKLILSGAALAVSATALLSSYLAKPDFAPSNLTVAATQLTQSSALSRPHYGASGTGATTSATTSGGQGSTSGIGTVSNIAAPGDAREAFDSVVGR